jgi:plasmid replication initiation protein
MGRQVKMELKAQEREVVAKANELIRARHSFSTYEQRIFAAMVAGISRDTTTFEMQKVPIQRICSESNASDLYRRIDEITDRLVDQKIEYHGLDQSGNREFDKINVFSRCRYNEGRGVIEARFTEDMRPLLLRLKDRFTLYLIKVFLRLRSKYSTQIYELLKMRQDLREIRMTVEELRRTLALEEKYEKFFSLKRRVIEQSRTELKEKADIYFTYDVIRDGKTPVEIEFFIHDNERVVEELKEEGQERSIPQKETNADNRSEVSAKQMFRRSLSQEELDEKSPEEIETLYRDAREAVIREEGKDLSETYLQSMVFRRMENEHGGTST